MGGSRNEIPTYSIYVSYLEEILQFLDNIEPSEENLDELTRAIQITQRVLNEYK